MKNHCNIFSLVVLLPLFIMAWCSSCTKFVQIKPPKNQIVSSQVFADSADANAAVIGVYTNGTATTSSSLNIFNGGLPIYTGLESDELYITTSVTGSNYSNLLLFYQNALLAGGNNSALYNNWTIAYSLMYQINACIEGISASTGISLSFKNQLIGEAKIWRAWLYFNMVNLYGGVPLVTGTDFATNQSLPRATPEVIYQQIVADLTDAQSLMTTSYHSAGRVRPNQYTATALLAKVYLYQGQWSKAEAAASLVINSGLYTLVPNLNNVFLAGSNEAIWQIIPGIAGRETTEAGNFLPSSTTVIPKFVMTNYLLNAFEPGDQRKVNWLKSNTVSGQTYYYPFKYKLFADNNTTPAENYMMFRLTEQYLIRAEAKVQQGNDLAGAVADLNLIRARAGLSASTASGQTALLQAIYHENQVEFFCEWGHRWYDMKRWNQTDAIMGTGGVCAAKGGVWDTNWQLWPIPSSQLSLNVFLTQNPGY